MNLAIPTGKLSCKFIAEENCGLLIPARPNRLSLGALIRINLHAHRNSTGSLLLALELKSVLSLWSQLLGRAYGLAELQARLRNLAKTNRSRSRLLGIKYPATEFLYPDYNRRVNYLNAA